MTSLTLIRPTSPAGRFLQKLATPSNWPVMVAVGVLAALGVLSVWVDRAADGSSEGIRQLIFVLVGFGAMFAFQWIDYRRIGRFSWAIYILALLLIGYTLLGQAVTVPGVRGVKGAYNWIRFGPVGLQPADLAKIGFVLVMARYLRFRSNYRTLVGLLPPFALALIPVAMILKQPDLGTSLVFVPTLFALLYIAGARISHLLFVVLLGLLATPVLWFAGEHEPYTHPSTGEIVHCRTCPRVPVLRHLPQFAKHYQRDRLYALFKDDKRTLSATGMQQHTALIAMGSGGLTGKGAGQVPIGKRVPEAHNDMVFALIGEQFGFFGSLVVLVAYVVLFVAGIEIASATREPFGRLIAVGVVAMLASQTFLNLLVATKLMPVTGVTLPLVSYGGSSLLASFMAIGLLLNVGQNRPFVMAKDPFEFED
jgi:rod shape determining protein RodA